MGLDKTGTTAIQNVLHANREYLLAEERLLYPSLTPNLSTPLLTIFKDNPRKHKANRMAGLTAEAVEQRRKENLNSLEAEISSCEWGRLLLSAEGVSSLREPEIAKLREWGEQYSSNWTVLVCVRHPISWARSVIQERLKQGDTLQQLYEDPPVPKYCQKISNAMSVFGRENVRVFSFEAAIESPGGIVGAFAARAGLSSLSGDFLAHRTVRANESLSLEAAHIIDSLNRQRPLFADEVRAPRRPDPAHVLPYISRIDGQKFDVPDSVKENIRSQSRDDVQWLNETLGLDLYKDILDPPLRTEGHEESIGGLSDPSIDSIAEIFGELIMESVLLRFVDRGRTALSRDNLDRADKILRKASRLDPDAPQPKELLKEVTERQLGNTQK